MIQIPCKKYIKIEFRTLFTNSIDAFKTNNPIIWDKKFKSRLSKFCGRQPLKGNFKSFFKGCLAPQNLLSPLLNTLSHMKTNQISLPILSKFKCRIN